MNVFRKFDIDDLNHTLKSMKTHQSGRSRYTAFATDADEKDAVKYSLSHDADGLFSIDEDSGITWPMFDYAGDKSLDITVLATSTDGSTASRFSKYSFWMIRPRTFPLSSTVIQNQTKFLKTHQLVSIGITTSATIERLGDNVIYSLTNDANGLFQIDSSSAKLQVVNSTMSWSQTMRLRSQLLPLGMS